MSAMWNIIMVPQGLALFFNASLYFTPKKEPGKIKIWALFIPHLFSIRLNPLSNKPF